MQHALPWYRRPFAALTSLLGLSKSRHVNDGWSNETSGLGTYGRDKTMHAKFERSEPLALRWDLLDSLYHEDDISGRIVDLPVDHMFREGWDVQVADDTTKEQAKAFAKYTTKRRIHAKAKLATTWGRLKGGSILLFSINDNRRLDQPVDESNIETIAGCHVIERQYVQVNSVYTDLSKDNFGEPETYIVTAVPSGFSLAAGVATGVGMFIVHESRTVRFEGATTNKLERQRLAGWTHSVLQRPYEKVKAFVQMFQASANLMTDASQGVYHLEGLHSQVSSNELELLETRMMMLDMGRSVARAIVLDKDGETFERTVSAISGYPEMLDRFMMLLSAATEIPVTLLMGRSAAGMNSTGDSDFRQFYDVIRSKQTHELEPILQRIYRLISLAKDGPTGGKEADIIFEFRSLWSPTIAEHSQINLAQSQADLNYVTMGAATGEEIALSRFQDGKINLFTKIDIKGRAAAQTSGKMFDPYEGEEEDKGAGEMDLKRQSPTDPQPIVGGPQAPVGRQGRGANGPNSTMPGNKSGAGR